MKAGELTLQGTLTAQQQYVIPIFQRYYTWDRKEWDQLWTDICELREKPGKRHFMGALVFVPDKTVTYSYPTYEVIDGQQRMITFSLLFAALRNICTSTGQDELANEITNSVLVHQYKKGRERFRVYPRQRDREDFMDAVSGTGNPANRVGKAIRFFTEAINETVQTSDGEALRAFYNVLLGGLEFVHINLGGENPYKIFRSLNSTGVDLSPADLIRNFVFMHIPIEEQDEFDTGLWTPLESRFVSDKNEVNSKLVSAFFRDFLMTSGDHIAPADTFEAFESTYKDGFDPRQLTAELTASAELYDQIRGADSHPDKDVGAALSKLRQLDSSTAYPLVLKLMGMMQRQQITAEQFVGAVESVTGFIFRRYICGETSRAYAKWFVAGCKEVVGSDPCEALERFLTDRGFPGNARFEAALCTFPLYSGKYAFEVLQQLEKSFGSKEPPDPDDATIEHVMPQALSKEWREDLGPDARQIHEQWVDTLGNLTFSGYNTGLSNKRFSVKMQGVGNTLGYTQSNFELTKLVTKYTKWGAEEIEKRGEELAERASEIWKGPTVTSVEDVGGRPENPFNESGTRAKLFNILIDGQWHSITTIQEQYRWDVQDRIDRLRAFGAKTGRWTIEQADGKVRMTWPENFVPVEASDELTEYRQTQLGFWAAFHEFMENNSDIRCQKPGPRNWLTHTIGYSGITLASVINSATDTQGLELRAELVLHGDQAKERFDALLLHREEIEKASGCPLIWYKPEDRKMCTIYLERTIPSLAQELWPEQHQWLKENLHRLRDAFAPYLKKLSGTSAQGASAGE
ncbi:MAG: DUF4268 domain-containing protein [Terriglobales bacterium]